jgi:hypothetical protein
MSCHGLCDCVSIMVDRYRAWLVPFFIYVCLSAVIAMFVANFFRAGSRRRTTPVEKAKADDEQKHFD